MRWRIPIKFWTLLMVPCFLVADFSKSDTKDVVCEKHSKESFINHLSEEEQQVYHQLGPLYQKIYLEALNDEERHRVVVYMHRGLNPYEAINVILRNEERKFCQNPHNHSVAPSDRSFQSCPKSESY